MKTGNDVRGAVGAEGACTRQKEKSRKWRVRSSGAEGARTRQKEKSKKWRVRSRPCHPGVPPQKGNPHTPKRKIPQQQKINLLGTFSNPTASYLYREHVTGCFG